jgi:hypothetical protein
MPDARTMTLFLMLIGAIFVLLTFARAMVP